MKFKVGDVVRVINADLSSYNAIGKIVDIDEDWHLPYEVEFELEYNEELFYESDLVLVNEEVSMIEDEKEPKVEDIIDELVDMLKAEKPSREISLAITHLQEAQNWLYRLERG